MAAIAEAAGVSVQTLYVAFGSKVAILVAAHDTAVVGDDEPVPLLQRSWVTEARADRDGLRALRTMMAHTLDVVARVHPIYSVIQGAAADPDVAPVVQEARVQRWTTLSTLAADLATKEGFAPGVTVDWAADVYYAINSDELYRLLVVDRGWAPTAWREWAYQSAAFRLFPGRLTSPVEGGVDVPSALSHAGPTDQFGAVRQDIETDGAR